MRRGLVVSLVAMVVLAAVSCTPPTPAPTLPTGVGVQWLRDTGGTVDPVDGHYTPAYDRYVLLNGAVAGPTPAGSTPDVVPPFNLVFQQILPDGTPMFPYNGFAGEGITGTRSPSGPVTLTFPSGSCQLPLFDIDLPKVFPSPDGTKVAVQVFEFESDYSAMRIYSLVDGGTCPQVVEHHFVHPGGGGSDVYAPAVWAPDSSAVAYTVVNNTDPPTQRVVRLAATTGATPADIIPATAGQLTPLGWSVADRLLVETALSGPSRLTLSTVPAAGGSLRALDTVPLDGFTTSGPPSVYSYLGYFVPGSTTVVFTGVTKVTNSTGQTLPWFRMRRIADAAGAVSAPLTSTKPPLTWHQQALDPISGPPFTLVDVPNSEVLERFTH